MIMQVKRFFAGLISDDLLRHTSILFSGMMVVHVCNMVFQMAVIRILPKEEYVLLAAFLAVLVIIQRPLSTLTTGVSHYSSLLRQEGRAGDVKRLLRKWLLLAGGVGLFLGIVTVVFNGSLSGFLHLNRVAPVVIIGAILPALFCAPVLLGAGQGLQLFKWCSTAGIFAALVRLGLGVGFIWFVVPACGWAMLGHGLSIYTSAGVLFLGLFLMLRGQGKSKEKLPSMRVYLLQSFFVLAAYVVLMTADVVLVKHFVPGDTDFAYAATLGRMVVFLPSAIVVAMFPKVVSRGTTTKHQQLIFFRSFAYTALFVAVAVVGCFVFPGLLARFFGVADVSVSLKRMIGLMAVVMGFSALLNVVVQFLLAQRRFKPLVLVVLCAVAYIMSVTFFHDNARTVVLLSGAMNLLALILTGADVLKTRKFCDE